jgi:hypothetical protein
MVFYLDDDNVAAAARGRADHVRSAFERLCEEDEEFDLSLQTTTKTLAAVTHRISAWGSALGGMRLRSRCEHRS